MFNEVLIVRPDYFKETGGIVTTDKNGKMNVFLQPIAGQIPNKAMVVAGSVAISSGICLPDGKIAGKLQMVLVNETAPDPEYGRQFSVTVLDSDVPATSILEYRSKLGAANVLDVNPKENATDEASDAKPSLNTTAVNTGKGPVAATPAAANGGK